MLTIYQGDEDILRSLEAGAATYLTKDDVSNDMLHTIREVHAGRTPFPSKVAQVLADRPTEPRLSPREIEVLDLVAKGMRNKEIAAALRISEETAKVHVKNVLTKLEVNHRTAAVHVALKRGILHLG